MFPKLPLLPEIRPVFDLSQFICTYSAWPTDTAPLVVALINFLKTIRLKTILVTEKPNHPFRFKWGSTYACVDHIDFAYYYLLCALATARLREAARHDLSDLSEKLVLESYKCYVAAQAYHVEVDEVFQPPIAKYNTEYVYLTVLDAEKMNTRKPIDRINACCRMYHNLFSLKGVPFWSAWAASALTWTKIQAAIALAVFINEQYNIKNTQRKDPPEYYARICVETIDLLSYTGTCPELMENAKRSLAAGYKNNTENHTPTYLRDILSGKFFEARKPEQEFIVDATLDELVPFTPMF